MKHNMKNYNEETVAVTTYLVVIDDCHYLGQLGFNCIPCRGEVHFSDERHGEVCFLAGIAWVAAAVLLRMLRNECL